MLIGNLLTLTATVAAATFGLVGLQQLLDRRVRVLARTVRRIPAHWQDAE